MNFNQELLYVMTLTLSIISIVYSYNVSDVNAQVNRTQALTIQLNPGERSAPTTETLVRESISPMGTIDESVPNALHWSCAAKAVNDSPEGNSLGWNPNGTSVQFTFYICPKYEIGCARDLYYDL